MDIIEPMKKFGYDIFIDTDSNSNTLAHQLLLEGIGQIENLPDGLYRFYTIGEFVDLDFLMGLDSKIRPQIDIPNNQGITPMDLIIKHHLKMNNLKNYDLAWFDWEKKDSHGLSPIDYIFTPIKLSEKRDNGLRYLMNLHIVDWAIELNIKQIMIASKTINYLFKSHVYQNRTNIVNLILAQPDALDKNLTTNILEKFLSYSNERYFEKEIVPWIHKILSHINKFEAWFINETVTNTYLKFGSKDTLNIDNVYMIWIQTKTKPMEKLLHKLWTHGIEFKTNDLKQVYSCLKETGFDHKYLFDFNHKWIYHKKFGSIVSDPFVMNNLEIDSGNYVELDIKINSDSDSESDSDLNSSPQTLCFGILDDLRFSVKKIIKCENKIVLKKAFKACYESIFSHSYLYWDYSNSPQFYKYDFDKLIDTGHLVWNQIEKYYVVCFGLDYETFNVWSRDYPSQEIQW